MNKALLLTNAQIYTLDGARPVAHSLLIQNGRILAVSAGQNETFNIPHTTIDMGGRCIIPGLIDAHVHFRNFALGLRKINVMDVPTRAETVQKVAERVASASPGEWIEGFGWSQDQWPDKAFPTAADLDAIAPNNPVYLRHKSGHAGWANSLALKIGGVTSSTPNPDGGEIQRDEAGVPTGILLETAMRLVASQLPSKSEPFLIDAMKDAQAYCWQVGLVGLHDFDGRDCFQALQTMRRRDELGLRFVKNIQANRIDYAVGVGLRSGFGDEWLRTGGIKIFADGALGPRTALMLEPYENDPNNVGIAITEKEEMMRLALQASANHLSVTIHAIGDKAVHDVLDVYETVRNFEAGKFDAAAFLPSAPKTTSFISGRQATSQPLAGLRHRIEHVQIIHPDDQQRLAELDVIASMQPLHATSDMFMADAYWGSRAKDSYAIRTMLDSGALVVFGSDCPIEPIDPLPGIHAAVTRQRADGSPGPDGWFPEQRVSMQEAIYGFTMAAARTSGQEAIAGTIEAGKLADLTILDRDIFNVPNDEILDIGVSGTMVNGEFKHRTF